MKLKGFIEIDALMCVAMVTVSAILLLALSSVRTAYQQTLDHKIELLNQSMEISIGNSASCVITYEEPIDVSEEEIYEEY